MHLGYYLPVFLMRFVLMLFSRLEVRGKDNIPLTGPLIVVSNHLSLVDPSAVSSLFQ